MLYRISTFFMLARLGFALPFFLSLSRAAPLVLLWVYFLLFANFAIQLSTFLRPLVILLSTFGLFTYSPQLDLAVFNTIMIMYTVTDLLTSLSILYMHHRMGLRQIANANKKSKVQLFRESS
jgi:hypothetical protein